MGTAQAMASVPQRGTPGCMACVLPSCLSRRSSGQQAGGCFAGVLPWRRQHQFPAVGGEGPKLLGNRPSSLTKLSFNGTHDAEHNLDPCSRAGISFVSDHGASVPGSSPSGSPNSMMLPITSRRRQTPSASPASSFRRSPVDAEVVVATTSTVGAAKSCEVPQKEGCSKPARCPAIARTSGGVAASSTAPVVSRGGGRRPSSSPLTLENATPARSLCSVSSLQVLGDASSRAAAAAFMGEPVPLLDKDQTSLLVQALAQLKPASRFVGERAVAASQVAAQWALEAGTIVGQHAASRGQEAGVILGQHAQEAGLFLGQQAQDLAVQSWPLILDAADGAKHVTVEIAKGVAESTSRTLCTSVEKMITCVQAAQDHEDTSDSDVDSHEASSSSSSSRSASAFDELEPAAQPRSAGGIAATMTVPGAWTSNLVPASAFQPVPRSSALLMHTPPLGTQAPRSMSRCTASFGPINTGMPSASSSFACSSFGPAGQLAQASSWALPREPTQRVGGAVSAGFPVPTTRSFVHCTPAA